MKKAISGIILFIALAAIFYTTKANTLIRAQEETPGVATDSSRLVITDIPSASASPTLIPVPTIHFDTDPLQAEEEFNVKDTTEIIVDANAPQTCTFKPFAKTVKKGSTDAFSFEATSTDEASIVKNSFFTGDLPEGVTASIDRAASKIGRKYDVSVNVETRSQSGSFNIPVIYKETTNRDEVHTSICQFNLIIE